MKYTIRELLIWMTLCGICFALTRLPAVISAALLILIAISAFFRVNQKVGVLYVLFSLLGICFILVMSEVVSSVFEMQVVPDKDEASYESRFFSFAVPIGVCIGSTAALILAEALRKRVRNDEQRET